MQKNKIGKIIYDMRIFEDLKGIKQKKKPENPMRFVHYYCNNCT